MGTLGKKQWGASRKAKRRLHFILTAFLAVTSTAAWFVGKSKRRPEKQAPKVSATPAPKTTALDPDTQDPRIRELGNGIPHRPIRRHPKNFAYSKYRDKRVSTQDLGPRVFRAINVHEHVDHEARAKMLLVAMDKFRIGRTCLMGTSWYTFTLNRRFGFERYKKNNEAIIRIRNKYPDRFCAFVTIDPEAVGNLKLVKAYVEKGADGIKLYLGHGASTGKAPFHSMPLDDARMMPVYQYAEKTQLPLVFHVNLNKYFEEFVRVMERHPYLRVNVPHFGLHKNTEARLKRFAWLLERYPNLYTDISFGWWQFHIEGFEAFAKWRTRSRAYFAKHAKKIMFGGDLVLEKTKTQAYVDATLRSYMQFLEAEKFRFFLEPDFLMHGLDLEPTALEDIYVKAPSAFLNLDKQGNLPKRTPWPPTAWKAQIPGLPPTVAPVTPVAPDAWPQPEGQ